MDQATSHGGPAAECSGAILHLNSFIETIYYVLIMKMRGSCGPAGRELGKAIPRACVHKDDAVLSFPFWNVVVGADVGGELGNFLHPWKSMLTGRIDTPHTDPCSSVFIRGKGSSMPRWLVSLSERRPPPKQATWRFLAVRSGPSRLRGCHHGTASSESAARSEWWRRS